MLLVHEIGCSIAAPLAGPLGRRSGIPCVVHQNHTGCTFQTPGELHDEAPKWNTRSVLDDISKYRRYRKTSKSQKNTSSESRKRLCPNIYWTSMDFNCRSFAAVTSGIRQLFLLPTIHLVIPWSQHPGRSGSRTCASAHVMHLNLNRLFEGGTEIGSRQNAWLGGSSSFLIASRIKSNRVFSGLIIDKSW